MKTSSTTEIPDLVMMVDTGEMAPQYRMCLICGEMLPIEEQCEHMSLRRSPIDPET